MNIAIGEKAIVEHVEFPFGKGDLTSDGIQWCTAVATTDADTDVEVESVDINPAIRGRLIEMEFGLTAAFQAVSSATADLKYTWQARNKRVGRHDANAWQNLVGQVTKTDIGTTYVEETYSGRKTVVNGQLDECPIEVRLVIQCNEASEGRAKVKNSSYVRLVYDNGYVEKYTGA